MSTISLKHHGATDGGIGRIVTAPIPTLDARLDAQPVRKLLSLCDVWDGLCRYRDELVEKAKELNTPFTVGRVLTAEPAPTDLDAGRVWDGIAAIGQFAGQVADTLRRKGRLADANTLLSTATERAAAIAHELQQFHLSQGTQPAARREEASKPPPLDLRNERANRDNAAFWRDQQTRSDGDRTRDTNMAKLKEQAARNAAFHTGGNRTGATSVARRRLTGDFSKPKSNLDLNEFYRKHWAAQKR